MMLAPSDIGDRVAEPTPSSNEASVARAPDVPDEIGADAPDEPDAIGADAPDEPDAIGADAPDEPDAIGADAPDASIDVSASAYAPAFAVAFDLVRSVEIAPVFDEPPSTECPATASDVVAGPPLDVFAGLDDGAKPPARSCVVTESSGAASSPESAVRRSDALGTGRGSVSLRGDGFSALGSAGSATGRASNASGESNCSDASDDVRPLYACASADSSSNTPSRSTSTPSLGARGCGVGARAKARVAGRASEDAPGAAGIGDEPGVDEELDMDRGLDDPDLVDRAPDDSSSIDAPPVDPAIDPAPVSAPVDPAPDAAAPADDEPPDDDAGAFGTDAWTAPEMGGGTVFPDRPFGGGGGFLRSTGASFGPDGNGATTDVDVDADDVAAERADDDGPEDTADVDDGAADDAADRADEGVDDALVDDALVDDGPAGAVDVGGVVADGVRVGPLLGGAFVADGVRVGPLPAGALVVDAVRPGGGVVRGASASGVWPSSVRIATGRSACAARTPTIRPTTSPAAWTVSMPSMVSVLSFERPSRSTTYTLPDSPMHTTRSLRGWPVARTIGSGRSWALG